jgi:hypothetical protein
VTGTIVAAFVAFFGTLVTVAVTYAATSVKVRRELESSYDLSLREARLGAYQSLWRLLQPLAKYARPEPVTYRLLGRMLNELRAWYFETGGLYLTEPSREAYFHLMDRLRDLTTRVDGPATRELPFETFEFLRELGSSLRTSMVEDVQTRRPSELVRAGSSPG